MKRVIALTGLAFAIGLSSMSTQAADYVAGKDYKVLDNPEKISGNSIIVREFFWYGCPHCYDLNPHMQKWATEIRHGNFSILLIPSIIRIVLEGK